MTGQILGNSTGIIKVTAANEGIGYNFGLHNGQHSNAARIAPGSKYRVLSDACVRIWHSILRTSGGPRRIRTPDPLIRSQVLYPAELSVRGAVN